MKQNCSSLSNPQINPAAISHYDSMLFENTGHKYKSA